MMPGTGEGKLHDPTAGERVCALEEELRALLRDELPAGRRDWLEGHLAGCKECVALLEELAAEEEEPWDFSRERASVGPESREMLAVVAQVMPGGTHEIPPGKSGGSEEPPHPPPRIPGFADLVEVGRGATGIVYRGLDGELQRPVAIKVLSGGKIPGAVARVHREAMCLARLKHPHVVSIYGTGEVEGVPYLVMEWIAGGTLESRLQEGPLPVREAAQLVRQLAQGVGAAHALGLVHRDLKPANVLLEPGPTPVAKLTDFGLARDLDPGPRLTATGVVLGTPSYMAPEQTGLSPALGEVGPSSDLYGLGAVAYAALVGCPPHQGHSLLDTLARVAWEEPESLERKRPEIPRDLATIVARCLRTQPGERYRSAGDLADDLERFLDGRPISARPYTWIERVGKWARRHPAGAVAAGLAGLLVAGGVLGTYYHVRTLNQTLADLEAETRRAARADEKATTAIASEQVSRAQSLDQLLMTTQLTRLLLERTVTHEPQDDELLTSLRHYLREQAAALGEGAAASAEAVGLGLSNVAYLEGRGARLEEALEDNRLLVELADRFPQSAQLQDLRLQGLQQQRPLLERLGRTAEAAEAPSPAGELSGARRAEQLADTGLAAVARSGALLRAGRREEALQVVDAALPLQVEAVRKAGEHYPEVWRRWLDLLSNQGRLRQELGNLSAAAESLNEWQSVGRQFVEKFPRELETHRRQVVAMTLRQIELEIGLGRLPDALSHIDQLRRPNGGTEGAPEIELTTQVDLVVQEIRARAMRGEEILAEPAVEEVFQRVVRMRELQPANYDLFELECRVRMSRAGLSMRLGRAKGALVDYERAIALTEEWEGKEPPGKPAVRFATDSHWLAAHACEALGELEGARSHLEQVVARSHEVNRNAALLRLVVIHLRMRDLAGARRAAVRVRNDVRSSAEALRLVSEGERRFQEAPPNTVPN
ncbi:MAG: protein kinase domain-containing protein [Planctomycetaceae bacterium]